MEMLVHILSGKNIKLSTDLCLLVLHSDELFALSFVNKTRTTFTKNTKLICKFSDDFVGLPHHNIIIIIIIL